MGVIDNYSANAALDVCGEWFLLPDGKATLERRKGRCNFSYDCVAQAAAIASCIRAEFYQFSKFSWGLITSALIFNGI